MELSRVDEKLIFKQKSAHMRLLEQVTSGGAPRTRGLRTTQEIIETNFMRIIFVCDKSIEFCGQITVVLTVVFCAK